MRRVGSVLFGFLAGIFLFSSCQKNDFVPVAAVETGDIEEISAHTAKAKGTVVDIGTGIASYGHCWGTTKDPTIDDFKTNMGRKEKESDFLSELTRLEPGTQYYIRAYCKHGAEVIYGETKNFSTPDGVISLTTASVRSITKTDALCGGNILSDGGVSVTSRGVVWSTSQNPSLDNNEGYTTDGSGLGAFTRNITGLTENTTYYVRAYATNVIGTAYGNQISFSMYNGTSIVEVTNPETGKTWMDRNLGASRAATSSTDEQAYGDLYQWGRAADGHEKRTSGTTSTLSNSDTPGHGDFITNNSNSYDWRSPQNDNLWQGVSGTNNPCPDGYRLPTAAELDAERESWSSNDAAGAFSSPLKLPVAGFRDYIDGSLYTVGSDGYYWSSTVDGTNSQLLGFGSGDEGSLYSSYRAFGLSVRCFKD